MAETKTKRGCLYIRDLSPKRQRAFHAACLTAGFSMTDVVESFMEAFVKNPSLIKIVPRKNRKVVQ